MILYYEEIILQFYYVFLFLGAIPNDEQVRITPSLKDQRGGLWAKTKSTAQFWEIEVLFRVSGRGRVGGDGLVSFISIRLYI